MREFEFEMHVCAQVETDSDAIVARQLGGGVVEPGGRILDVIVVTPGPEFDRRRAITAAAIPPQAIESPVGPGRARPVSDVSDRSRAEAERVCEEAIRVGFFERVRGTGVERVRQSVRYPDWVGEIVAIENKPDLRSPGDLVQQLRRDVSLGLVDRVILATRSHVTGAHLNRIPHQVGVWRVKPDAREEIGVIREPTPLHPDDWGIEILDRAPSRTHVRTVSPSMKARARTSLAERAYGKGWRLRLPHCEAAGTTRAAEHASLPYCTRFKRVIDPAHCGPDCEGHVAGDPMDYDRDAERAVRTPWTDDPPGVTSEQTGLSTFKTPASDRSA